MSEMLDNRYVQVIVDIPSLDSRTFSYAVPDELRPVIKIGLPVLVPFGSQGVVNAYIVGFSNYMPEGIKAKSIYELLNIEPIFDLNYLKFLEWVSTYYCCDLPTVIETALPVKLFSKVKRIAVLKNKIITEKIDINQQKIFNFLLERSEVSTGYLQKKLKFPPSKFYEALRKLKSKNIVEIINVIDSKSAKVKVENWIELLSLDSNNKRYSEILEKLDNLGKFSKLGDFQKGAKTTLSTLRKLEASGNVRIFESEVFRNPLSIFGNTEKEAFFRLNFDQESAVERVLKAVEEKDSQPFLLFGITGSGKTEVYMQAAKEVVKKGQSVIFLAPEIALASQLADRISKRFGNDIVSIWHSNLSEGERYDVWQKIRKNEVKIIVGARSAIFAPMQNVGLIIIDEEHESSYKQTSPTPRYNAKELACERAKREGACLVLGSATPDVVTYYRAINTNRVLLLPERFGGKNLARVSIVDMKSEFEKRNKSIFSHVLKNALQKNLDDGKQSLLLINRRGFTTYTQCNSCGYTAECSKCSIPLILHKTNNKLRCHYCGHEEPVFVVCPKCMSSAIKYSGMGSQKVEEEFRLEFPTARVARLDSDIMAKKNAHIEILDQFTKSEIDVLIGTQMIAKGLDIPNVTLVGVLSADSLFTMPDFRASERGLQLLTQVAGRAGRGDTRGVVYFQTYNPEMYALKTAKEQDYLTFYYSEIQARYEFSYPPYSSIIRLIVSCKNEIKSRKYAEDVAYKLKTMTETRGIDEKLEVLGPAPCIISKMREEYRFQIVIKNRLGENGHFITTSYIKKFTIPEDIKFLIDVDPSDML